MISANNEFVVAMARTLWLMSLANVCEEQETEWEGDVPSASGYDWDDVAPETPIEAVHAAMYAIGHWEALNRVSVLVMIDALELEAENQTGKSDTPRIAHCVAMQMLGSGVGLVDESLDKVSTRNGVIRVPLLDMGELDLSDTVLLVLDREFDCRPVTTDEK